MASSGNPWQKKLMAMDKREQQYQKEVRGVFKCLDAFITKQFGDRCDEYEPLCVVCKMWLRRDEMREIAS